MSIDRAELLETLEVLPFDRGAWVVAGSAPMLLAGLIDSITDIDLVVDDIAWHDVRSLGDGPPVEGLHGDRMVSILVGAAVVEVFDGWLGTSAEVLLAEAVEIEGVPSSPLERVLDSKRRLGRRRDLDHIRIIETHLGGAGSE